MAFCGIFKAVILHIYMPLLLSVQTLVEFVRGVDKQKKTVQNLVLTQSSVRVLFEDYWFSCSSFMSISSPAAS